MKKKFLLAGGAVLILAVTFLAGRYSRSARVETKIEYKEKIVAQSEEKDKTVQHQEKGPVRIVIRTVEKPGAERVVEKIIERGPVVIDTTKDHTSSTTITSDRSLTEIKVVTNQPNWAIGLNGLWQLKDPSLKPMRYGLEADGRIFGSLWLGGRASIPNDFNFKDLFLGAAVKLEW